MQQPTGAHTLTPQSTNTEGLVGCGFCILINLMQTPHTSCVTLGWGLGHTYSHMPQFSHPQNGNNSIAVRNQYLVSGPHVLAWVWPLPHLAPLILPSSEPPLLEWRNFPSAPWGSAS